MVVAQNTQKVLPWITRKGNIFSAVRCVFIGIVIDTYGNFGDGDYDNIIRHDTNSKENTVFHDFGSISLFFPIGSHRIHAKNFSTKNK